ncbi:MAG: phosphotransferase [Candidatus Thermoplasmatota archaeon]
MKEKIEEYLKEKYGDIKNFSFSKYGKGVHGYAYSVVFGKDNEEKRFVLKTLEPKNFGHDYFSDRAQVFLYANRVYNNLPKHVKSIDVLAESDKKLISVGDAKEFYILMEEAKGEDYFQHLERIKENNYLTGKDEMKAKLLSDYLFEIHKEKLSNDILYKRRIRELIGHGECIMGIIDTYEDVEFTDEEELIEIAMKSMRFWKKMRNKGHRLSQVHGDFHPGNIWWRDDDFILLDRSRGEYGEPADDLSCLSINYLFYSLLQRNRFEGDFKRLFQIFFNNYIEKTGDREILSIIQPFYAFRAIVIANPLFYPNVSNDVRRKLFNFAQNVLAEDEFDIESIGDYIER